MGIQSEGFSAKTKSQKQLFLLPLGTLWGIFENNIALRQRFSDFVSASEIPILSCFVAL
jgi:hypothetical protein